MTRAEVQDAPASRTATIMGENCEGRHWLESNGLWAAKRVAEMSIGNVIER